MFPRKWTHKCLVLLLKEDRYLICLLYTAGMTSKKKLDNGARFKVQKKKNTIAGSTPGNAIKYR